MLRDKFIDVNRQRLENNPAIWSHCFQYTKNKFRSNRLTVTSRIPNRDYKRQAAFR